jgi:hypothetical protein
LTIFAAAEGLGRVALSLAQSISHLQGVHRLVHEPDVSRETYERHHDSIISIERDLQETFDQIKELQDAIVPSR